MRYLLSMTCAAAAALLLCTQPASGHGLEMLLGSTAPGSGALALDYDFADEVVVSETFSVGGMTLYNDILPGFEWIQQDDPDEGLYALPVGTPFSIRITGIEAGVSVNVGGTILDSVGKTAFVATITDVPDDHFHPQWQLVLPTGEVTERSVSFVVTTTAPGFATSVPYTLVLTNAPEATPTPAVTNDMTPTPTPTLGPDPLGADANCDACLTGADVTALIRAVAIAPTPPMPSCPSSGLPDGVTVEEQISAIVGDLFNSPFAGCAAAPVQLRFRAMVGDLPFQCGEAYDGIGTTAQELIPSDFRFYIHDVRLVTPDGREVLVQLRQDGVWQYQNLVLLDFEDKTRPCNNGTEPTNAVVDGTAPPLRYTGVRFMLGLPFEPNHGDALAQPSPLNLSSMFWSWQGGHKFLRVDTALDEFRIHLGSTGCDLGPGGVVSECSRLNLGEVDLSGFDPGANVIVADLAAALADSDLSVNLPDTPPGCMSDPGDTDCEPIFRNLGIDFSDGSPDPGNQTFFRVE